MFDQLRSIRLTIEEISNSKESDHNKLMALDGHWVAVYNILKDNPSPEIALACKSITERISKVSKGLSFK